MNFVAIPPGAGIAAALTLRGADPMLVVANADTFVTLLGDALHSVAAGAKGCRRGCNGDGGALASAGQLDYHR
jgi:hypothetical protein